MKQVVLRAGAPAVIDVPAPSPEPGRVLVANLASVISSGTERAAAESGGAIGALPMRMLRDPDLVKAGIRHLRERGFRETVNAARGEAGAESPLGYSCAGLVVDTGGIAEFRVGQLVACAGAGSANHAEVVSVAGNLVAAAPHGLDPRAAAFTTIGAIALQGVRRAAPALGERVVVVGLGLIGVLTTQLLAACGCQVLGIEPSARRRELALSLGAETAVPPNDAIGAVQRWSGGLGADAALICAAGGGHDIVSDTVKLIRTKGRVVVVGDVPLAVEREPLYRREADLLISTSYGPGRYDPTYEESGVDYPPAYVRWTENRNMGEVLRLLASGGLEVEQLIELEVAVGQAASAYTALAAPEPPLAAVLTYDARDAKHARADAVRITRRGTSLSTDVLGIAIVGAGSFVTDVHIPNIKRDAGARVVVVAARHGTSAEAAARALGGADTTTDWRAAVDRDDVDLVLVGTRHNTHAEIAAAALRAGKAVFVEKPLGLTREEIDEVWNAGRESGLLAVGFNRRLAPLAQALERELRQTSPAPAQLVYRVSAPLERGHWLNDPAVGGGRILGEACHMFDFANWLCGKPERVAAAALPSENGVRTVETSTVTIQYANGSIATVHYVGVGASGMPKERIEVMSAGRSWVLDDFTSLTTYANAGSRTESAKLDKGHAAIMERVLMASRGEAPFEPGLEAGYVAQSVGLAALEAIATGKTVAVQTIPV